MRLQARNGLVNKVRFFGLITRKQLGQMRCMYSVGPRPKTNLAVSQVGNLYWKHYMHRMRSWDETSKISYYYVALPLQQWNLFISIWASVLFEQVSAKCFERCSRLYTVAKTWTSPRSSPWEIWGQEYVDLDKQSWGEVGADVNCCNLQTLWNLSEFMERAVLMLLLKTSVSSP